MNRTVECVSFLLMKAGKILIERRPRTKRIEPGILAIPSGVIEEGETREEALVREIREEFDVTPTKYSYMGSLLYRHKEADFALNYYLVTEWEGEVQNKEAEELLWIDADQSGILSVWQDKVMAEAAWRYERERKPS